MFGGKRLRGLVIVAAAHAGISCGSSIPAPAGEAERLRQQASGALGSNPKGCTVERKATEPDLFGWDSGSRGKVKANAEQGLVVVHFEEHGCDIAISVLNCTTRKASYHYTPRHAQQSKFAENEGDLYAHFPVAVAELRARLGASRGIRADYRAEGIDQIPIGTIVAPQDLQGDECDGATHVVRAIHRGAFAIGAGPTADLHVGGTLFEANVMQRLSVFDADGTPAKCEIAAGAGSKTVGCDEPLRIELQPIVPRAQPAAPPATQAAAQPAPSPEPARSDGPAERLPSVGGAGATALVGGTMVQIPGGTLRMGDRNDTVTVAGFWLDVTEVTADAYAACVRSGRCSVSGQYCEKATYGVSGKGNHPINCVDWTQSTTYCAALGRRLPTEEEWEWAARGTSRRSTYPWGNGRPQGKVCWDRAEGTCAVGSYPSGDSPQGVKDLAGNVEEWTASNYNANNRVIRGSSWYDGDIDMVRASFRYGLGPSISLANLGFRCARSLDANATPAARPGSGGPPTRTGAEPAAPQH